MKAIQISGLRQMQIVSVPEQELHADEVLLRLEYVGFCGSDLSTYLGKNPMVKMPVIPGHEIGAVIEKVGADVPEGLKPGMTVTCNPYTNCGKCASCRNSRVNACQHNETLGVQRNGAMREYIVLPWEKVIPAGLLTPRTCALIEPMSVGFHAVSRAQVTDIDVVLVIGCGMVGMGAVVRSAQRGATVVAADIDDEKLELAKQMGASYTINTKTEDVHARLLEMTSGFGPDVVIEAVGSTQTYQMAVDEVAFTGRVICIGYAKTRYRSRRSSSCRRNSISVVRAMPSLAISVLSSIIWNVAPVLSIASSRKRYLLKKRLMRYSSGPRILVRRSES